MSPGQPRQTTRREPSGVTRARPILKWAGGKQALAEDLVHRFPSDFDTFYEPFVGGASVLLKLAPGKAVIGDSNDWLLDTYEAVRRDWKRVTRILDRLENTKDTYLRVRATRPETLDVFHRAAHLVYLNKTCFRGLFRVNRRGEFNVPYGGYERRLYDESNIRAVASRLDSVTIRRGDFEACLAKVSRNDFVYLDPPYVAQGGYADFDRYTARPFRDEDHVRLSERCRRLDGCAVRWALSNSDTPRVRELYAGFRMQPIRSRREINLHAKRRGIRELLITNYT